MERALVGCWVSPGWSRGLAFPGRPEWAAYDTDETEYQGGLAQVVVARAAPRGRVSICSFLVDVFCLGVKSVIPPRTIGPGDVTRHLHVSFAAFDAPGLEVPLELAQHLVFGAVDYARQLGFEPGRRLPNRNRPSRNLVRTERNRVRGQWQAGLQRWALRQPTRGDGDAGALLRRGPLRLPHPSPRRNGPVRRPGLTRRPDLRLGSKACSVAPSAASSFSGRGVLLTHEGAPASCVGRTASRRCGNVSVSAGAARHGAPAAT